MDDLDLNIQNYDLEDILNLFKLNYQFTEQNLKQAYKSGHANGLGAGSLFIYQSKLKGVLINYPEIKRLKDLYN